MLNEQVYLDRELIAMLKTRSEKSTVEGCAEFLLRYEGVARTLTATDIEKYRLPAEELEAYRKGYNRERCGDVFIQLKAGWMDKEEKPGHYTWFHIRI